MDYRRKAVAAATAFQGAARILIAALPRCAAWSAAAETAALRREVHAAQEVLEARVGAQGIEGWVDLEEG